MLIVEYGDFQCPYCGQARRLLDTLSRRHGADVALVWRHLPLAELHPHAEGAARASEAAARQDRFWDMHDRLFDHQQALHPDGLLAAADALRLDLDRFAADIADPAVAARVARDRESASAAGLSRTPSFYLDGAPLLDDWPTLPARVAELLHGDRPTWSRRSRRGVTCRVTTKPPWPPAGA